MQRTNIAVSLSLAATIIISLLGCNEAPFDVAPVRGTVTLDGHPLRAGKVMFAPIRTAPNLEAGKPAIGVIQEDGTFELSTYSSGDGAVVGEHWVTVFGSDPQSAITPKLSQVDELLPATATFERISVTEKQTVKSGAENQVSIVVTSNDVAKFSVRNN